MELKSGEFCGQANSFLHVSEIIPIYNSCIEVRCIVLLKDATTIVEVYFHEKLCLLFNDVEVKVPSTGLSGPSVAQ